MSRAGGFTGGGLNPFGSGSPGGLGKYDIASDLADLEVYKVEVAWGNGLATNDAYLAALNKALAATDPNTQKRETAQNKLDDATYRIGRSTADKKGLDELIAFDQSSLAKMKTDNVRYQDIDSSLKAELAQRRSRDYGKLIVDYNAGKTSTESLLTWVKNAQKGIAATDPDFDNWQGVAADLSGRIDSERDSKAYQDYQQDRITGREFTAYLTKRRDGFAPNSPQWDDWNRKLEDASKQVKDRKQAETDQAFFNSYEEGHKSDKQYLSYLKTRIGGMEKDDPDRPTWQHRLNQAAFSLAEDKLRFDVEHNKAPVGKLVSFYRHYRSTLNPGSAEYRTITRSLDTLAHYGGSGGSGHGGKKKTGTGGGVTSAIQTTLGGKVIKAYTIEGALALMTINPNASKKSQATAKKYFDLNYTSLENARQRGDHVFLFFDPRKPGATVFAKNPDGSPILDAHGKPVRTFGSAYLPVSDSTFSQLNMVKANYEYNLAIHSLAKKDSNGYALHLKWALNAQDKARLVDSQATQHAFDQFYQIAQDGIDAAVKSGDYAKAMNLSIEMGRRLAAEIDGNPMLDDTRREKLERLGEKLSENPLIPRVDPSTGKQTGGAIDLAGSTKDRDGNFATVSLKPGWHHVLDKVDSKGGPSWGLEFDNVQNGSWEANHVQVTTTHGNAVVTGEVTRRQAGTNPSVFVNTDEGMIQVPAGQADYITFTDENGQKVSAYSLDGKTWVRSLSGTAPTIEVTKPLTKKVDRNGVSSLVDAQGKEVFKGGTNGWSFVGDTSDIAWYGTANAQHRGDLAGASSGALQTLGQLGDATGLGDLIGSTPFGQLGKLLGDAWNSPAAKDFGGPGQQMQLVTSASDGSVNFMSDHQQAAWEKKLQGAPRAIGSGGRSVNDTGWLGAAVKFGQDAIEGVLIQGLGLGSKPGLPDRLAAKPPPRLQGDTRSENRYATPLQIPKPAAPKMLPGDSRSEGKAGLPVPPALKPAAPLLPGDSRSEGKAGLPPIIKPKAPLPPKPKAPAKKKATTALKKPAAKKPPSPPTTTGHQQRAI